MSHRFRKKNPFRPRKKNQYSSRELFIRWSQFSVDVSKFIESLTKATEALAKASASAGTITGRLATAVKQGGLVNRYPQRWSIVVEPPQPPPQEEFVAGTVEGYRVFRVQEIAQMDTGEYAPCTCEACARYYGVGLHRLRGQYWHYEPRLRPISSMGYVYHPPGPWRAEHKTAGWWYEDDKHEPPEWNCECGFWVYRAGMSAQFHMRRASSGLSLPLVVAKVTCWGKVIEHQLGFRAEWMKIDQVTAIEPRTPEAEKMVKEMEVLYGIG